MRKLLLSLLLSLCFLLGYSQTFNNSWIPFSNLQAFSLQQYFKIKIVNEGIYRIDQSILTKAGIPLKTSTVPNALVDYRNLQLFVNGKELPIYIDTTVTAGGTFLNYIEFYGKGNDGALDSVLYKDLQNSNTPGHQPNPYYSLFNDTATYFLTWNALTSNKRIKVENDSSFASYTASPYFFRKVINQYTSGYYQGKYPDPDYVEGEGWLGNEFTLGQSKTVNLATPNAYVNGPDVVTKLSIAGASDFAQLSPDHHLNIQIGGLNSDTIFNGYGLYKINHVFPAKNLSANTPYVLSSIDDWSNDQNPARFAMAFVSCKYPHTFNFLGETATSHKLYVADNPLQSKSYINISNFPTAGSKPLLYDLSTGKRIFLDQKGGTIKGLIANSGGEKECYLTTEGQVTQITTIVPVSSVPTSYARFTNYQNNESEYIIISHKSIYNEATNYKNYRNLKFKTLLVDINELYDQFAYGVVKHPSSIRNFADFLLHSWKKAPENIFLIGKSISAPQCRNSAALSKQCLVPSYGYPASDNLLTAGLTTLLYIPSIPIGRLSAQSNSDVQIYLEKVKSYEQQEPAKWMKNVLHFGGGANTFEQNTFANYLRTFEQKIKGPYFGGNVYSFLKTSSSVIQINQSDFLHALIDTGVSIMTFFGHAYGNGFDQNIDLPSAYNNKDRYPLIIANSCFAGDIHTPKRSISEDFVLIKDKGSIGFLASISEGYSFDLYNYSNSLYKQIAKDNYGKSIGSCIKKTIEDIQYPGYLIIKTTSLEMTLHGDPAIIINSPPKPDLVITPSDVFTTPQTITTQTDSFSVNIVVTNKGKIVTDSFDVEIKRTLPDGSLMTILKKISLQKYKDTIIVKLPGNLQQMVGLNAIAVYLDKNDSIQELSELNNETSIQVVIQSDDIIPIYPYKYAIIPNDTVTLKASTSNPFAPAKDYIFEFDTTDTFDSPALIKQKILNAKGGVVTWKPAINFKDSTVYFWRVSPDVTNGNYKWRESSFIYIPGKTGWSQAHFFQFKNDQYQSINYKKQERNLEFVKTIGALQIIKVPLDPYISINNTVQEFGLCYSPSILVSVHDPLSLKSWGTKFIDRNDPSIIYNPDHEFGNFNSDGKSGCARVRIEQYFAFRADDPEQLRNLAKMLKSIPQGYYMSAITAGKGNFNTWNDSVLKVFENLGASKIRTLTNNPYIFFTQVGDPSTTKEVVGDNDLNPISFSGEITGKAGTGKIISEIIGPSGNWTSIHWRETPKEQPSKDDVSLNLYGIRSNGSDSLIIAKLNPSVKDSSIAFINAQRFPYLKFTADVSDDSLRTPADLKKWQVYYDPKPEAALNPSRLFTFYGENIDEGDSIRVKIAIENVSPYDMDSMLYYIAIYDKDRIIHKIPFKRQRPLPGNGKNGSIDTISISISTEGFTGLNSLWIEANPFKDQLEQYHFNNIAQIFFNVNKDKINPLMDVTFDGSHIMDGDIVSPKPFILAQLRDENKFLILDTASLFKLYLKYPDASDETLFPFDNKIAKFVPASSSSSNKCRLEFTPESLKDGKYQLRIQSKDKSNNLSGYLDYKINFEVVNKSTITEVMNYPNPFSTSTQFVFTITGSELPTYFKIQIMTVTGKIVREIMLDELGPIRIGRNITSYAWNGKDEFGDQLANGLYLYRIVTKINANEIEKKQTEADKFFKGGLGKMYLMR